MEVIEKKEYSYREILLGEIIENKIFKDCKFYNCILSYMKGDEPSLASVLRNCQFINCYATEAASQTGGILENVLIENLKIQGTLSFSNVLFKNTVFKGKIGKLTMNSQMHSSFLIFDNENYKHKITEPEIKKYDEFRINYYNNIEIAIDISQAEFAYCQISPSIPAALIKRNPETQALIKFENISKNVWKKNTKLKKSILEYRFETAMLEKADIVFVAPKLDKKDFIEYMELIKILREEGIAELD